MSEESIGKIFVLSRQRCGTTSTGDFLESLGISTCRETPLTSQLWALFHLSGQNEEIFRHPDFINHRAFEDNPWWRKNMFKELINFPRSKFILLHRDPDNWFDSMKAFNGGYIFELPILHMTEYERTEEYFDYYNLNKVISRNQHFFKIEEHHRHAYTALYEKRHAEIVQFFSEKKREKDLFLGELGDRSVWKEMANFLGIEDVPITEPHSNKRGKVFQPMPSGRLKLEALVRFGAALLIENNKPETVWKRDGESYILKK